ncbi:hypothetical protein AQ908_08520, partial [Burkholderia pseudomallei]
MTRRRRRAAARTRARRACGDPPTGPTGADAPCRMRRDVAHAVRRVREAGKAGLQRAPPPRRPAAPPPRP